MPDEKQIDVRLSEDELRYLVSVGIAAIQNIPEKSLTTYTNFNKDQIISFSMKIRALMDQNDI